MNAVRSVITLVAVTIAASCGGEPAAPALSSPTPAGSSSDPPAAPAPGAATTPAPSPSSPTPAPTPACQGKEDFAGTFEWKILERTVHVHFPTSYDPAKRTPVVLDFHGYTSNGRQQAAYTGMEDKADAAGFIAVHPEGTGVVQSWNAGVCCGVAATLGTADVDFVGAILDELQSKVCVDDRRIFATGMSNGGFLSHRLACELSTRIAAIAPVAGVLGVPDCTPARPVPVMQFHGTADTLVPYAGNPVTSFPSVDATIAGWAERNGCTDAPKETFAKDDVSCMTRSQCKAGAEVTLCTVDLGGHTWPGATLSIYGLGKTTQAIDATDAMWDFFQKHPMP